MAEQQPTTRQLIIFTVVLSFIVSLCGTILGLGFFGPLLGTDDNNAPLLFNRPQKILERIITGTTTTQISEKVLRQDELIVRVVQDASPAVVSVVASKDVPVIEQYFVDPFSNDPLFKQFFGDGTPDVQVPQYRQKGVQRKDVSAATGFIVSADGLIVTNKHVVADQEASYTVLMNDGKKKPAKVLALDPLNDIAVLKIEGTDFPFLRLGDSLGVKIGQTAITIGNALGEFRNTVSLGVISGLHRSVVASASGGDGVEALQELIQTDAAINPGNSGGPLLNVYGEVVGINTAIAQGAQSIGFSIPIVKVKRDLDSIKASGKITYPVLGVRFTVITDELVAKEKLGRNIGMFVSGSIDNPAVVPDSPAAKAGIKGGDIILSVNGEKLDAEHTLASVIQKYQVGDEVMLKAFRDGKEFDVKVKLEERK